MKHTTSIVRILIAAVLGFAILQPSPGHSADKPNIILIMSDDITMSLRDCKKLGRAAN